MKKNILLMTIISLMSLSSCGENKTSSVTSSTEELSSTTSSATAKEVEFADEQGVIFSEYVEGTGSYDKAIEIYNNTDNSIDLSNYSVAQYRSDLIPTAVIPLEGILAPKSCFVLTNDQARADLLEKANMTSPNLTFTGKNALTLNHNGKAVDVIGYLGYSVDYAKDITLVRKVDRFEARHNYNEYDWINYGKDYIGLLGGATNTVTPEELLGGPKLEDKYFDTEKYPFYVKTATSSKGGGGVCQASIRTNIDGDTTNLYIDDPTIDPTKFMTSTSYYGKSNGTWWVRVRYQAVDTPESYPGNIQEFGKMAAFYTAYLQNKANEMFIQTVAEDSLLCNYGRLMGYVWAGRDTMVNYETIKHGYSTVTFNYHYSLTYKDIPYESFMYNAKLYAKENKLGLYGEKDPYWDYDTNTSKCENADCKSIFE